MSEIDQAAYEYTKSVDDAERVIVGVNKFVTDVDVDRTSSRSIPCSSGIRSID
jgi:methylmalonyl-CoA mutase N-terminal domain/subunit